MIDLSDGIDFIVGWPPSINNYYARTRRGVYIKAKGKQYRISVAEDLQEQIGSLVSISDEVFLSVILYPPDKRVRDLDNHMKALLDAITISGLWDDDRLVSQLYIYKGEVAKGGKVKVHIGEAMPVVSIDLEPIDLL